MEKQKHQKKVFKKKDLTEQLFNIGANFIKKSKLKEFSATDRLSIIEFIEEVYEAQKPLREFEIKTFSKYATGTNEDGVEIIENGHPNLKKYNEEIDEALSAEIQFKTDISGISIPKKLIGSEDVEIILGLKKLGFQLQK